jgi:hypothetical protein
VTTPRNDQSSANTHRGLANIRETAALRRSVKTLEPADSDGRAKVQSGGFSGHARPTRRDLIRAPLVPRANLPESGKGFWIRDSNHSSMEARVNRQSLPTLKAGSSPRLTILETVVG